MEGIKSIFGYFSFIVVLIVLLVIVWIAGRREQVQHIKRVNKVPIRIHVNGIRGKSTVTRLIGGALRESGLKTMTKTTGKGARIIEPDGNEKPIARKGKPNIREQIDIMKIAVHEEIHALVIECMAVHPELQRVAERKMIQSTIGVITNVRTDHLDVMGPTLEDVARSLCNTIPRNGILVTAEDKYLYIMEEHAKKVGARIIKANPEEINDELITSFSYLNFKENVAIALEISRLLGIPDDIAIEGMLKANPDPGVMKIYRPTLNGSDFMFVNAFGVNDKDSTVTVYRELMNRGYFDKRSIVGVFHARGDRVTRTVEFGDAMVSEMDFEKIIICGKMTNLFVIEAIKALYCKENIINLGECTAFDTLNKMAEISKEMPTVFFGCGNMIGEIPGKLLEVLSGSEG
ncbi:Mur ligase middle domain protein [uncultured archaeon]|nr:Mur ligase middle domain protein [uncultured archaeon]